MKRSKIKPSISDFEREFRAMKLIVHERSQGVCEAAALVAQRVLEFLYAPDSEEHTAVLDAAKEFLAGRECLGRATNTHHRKYRSRGGTNSLDNLIDLCGPCHEWIHAYPIESNLLGLSLHANESEEIPSPH